MGLAGLPAPQPITARCDTTFRASRQSGRRELASIAWVVIHDEEAPTAIAAARWFADRRPPEHGGPAGSAHLCVDDDFCFRTLPNDVVPWAASSAAPIAANSRGFHIETAGFSIWTARVWRSHVREARRAAYKTALHLAEFNLPVQFVTAANLPQKHGVTTHREITFASKRLDPGGAWKYTHTDPGAFWPRRWFMGLVREAYDALGV